MPYEGYADPVTNDGPRFHSNVPVSELTEASLVSSDPSIAETTDKVTYEIQLTPTEPNGARGLKPSDPNSGIQLTRVRRLAHEGLEAAPCQTKLGDKMYMSPVRPSPSLPQSR